ncbi:WbqC family protein [Afipia massiliensis]|nr:WbqC family protein [Afipia massiliensis]
MSLKVAIMQPYFFPYNGYFRLFSAADMFVVLDCVQFPRRGYVHRNQLSDSQDNPQWLTLPLLKADRDATRICDLRFAPAPLNVMLDQFRRFPCLTKLTAIPGLSRSILDFERTPVEYLVDNLRQVADLLELRRPTILSSSLDISSEFKAQDRIIEIAKRVDARHYINAPGGKGIYDPRAFADAGLTLNFLSEYQGSFKSILERLLTEDAKTITGELQRNTILEHVSV